ncbi:sulfatase-modifying factor 1 [Pseudoclavibacter sp. RFBG4]|uniref:formylglycine-generating enzyme family protein n=1 Tax=Pseudoclavibacter sp. RFBG4 TaxID=2080575 RepID=UPI000CE77B32|nr:formylglycine-generating enzyme family protein [Pseudoclavibacter sp. RFBG4]PPG28662.1 sulfatase-modifying factor 1 [Pseudoclavibacter sp. RFBG4]
MITLDSGDFLMGSQRHYPEESPTMRTSVASFELAATAVTNAQFSAFVQDTGYVTVAERPLPAADFPSLNPDELEAGSLVFQPTDGPVDLRDWRAWWKFQRGACWTLPRGLGSSIETLGAHPVVHIAYEDAEEYARWLGARLPTEPEWEYAARGGLEQATYAWGEAPNTPGGRFAKTWQGRFPFENEAEEWPYTAPVGEYPPNGFGLFDMTGNTWEWTSSVWTPRHDAGGGSEADASCACSPQQFAPASTRGRVTKGGSHLCSPAYCLRYRPAARTRQTEDSSTSHLGFRIARSTSA